MAELGTGSASLAEEIFKKLVGDENAGLPQVDLYGDKHNIPWDEESAVFQPVERVTIDQALQAFEALMKGWNDHLVEQYEKGRITGTDYAKTYIALSQQAMQSAIQFVLGQDQAFWMAAKTQADAITSASQNEVVKLEAMLRRASFALTKLKLATEDSTYGSSEYQRLNYLPTQVALAEKQITLVHEQAESQHAQTANQRLDNTGDVAGLLGKQKDLYTRQIQSFEDDIKIRAAKIFSDLWVTQKTINEAVEPSVYFGGLVEDVPGAKAEALDGIFKKMRIMAGAEDFDPNDPNVK